MMGGSAASSLEAAMYTRKKKKMRAGQSSQGSEDVISNLNEDVMNLILAHLPIRDAVRTSTLSKKWRYKWVSIPDIVFDERHFVKGASGMEFVHVVDEVLMRHVGPIRKFSCMLFVLSSSHIDRWIVFLSRSNIENLTLKVSKDYYDMPSSYYDVPSSIFCCQKLCHLELFNCRLKVPPTFKGFHNLLVLNFQNINISGDGISCLISKSPLLERVTLRDFDLECLNIHAPNLRYLDLGGRFNGLSLPSSPLLTILSIHLWGQPPDHEANLEHDETRSLIQFIGCPHRIERLVLKGYFLEFLSVGSVPGKLSATYDHLKYLDVAINLNLKEISAILCIMRSAPNLKELKIKCFSYGEDTILSFEEFWVAQTQFGCLLSHLQVVQIIGIFGMRLDLDFIRYVLTNAPVLETMKLYINTDVGAKDASWILMKLLRFRRASTQAEILFLGPLQRKLARRRGRSTAGRQRMPDERLTTARSTHIYTR